MKPKYQIGQWVRFYKNGQLVIGVIQYIDNTSYPITVQYCTDHGEISESRILEAR